MRMTAKRFKIEEIEEELYPMPIYYDGDKELQYDEVCELLNELHEFNQDLSENLSVCADKRLSQGEYLTKLNNENEQLKEELEQCKAVIDNRWSEYLKKKELQE